MRQTSNNRCNIRMINVITVGNRVALQKRGKNGGLESRNREVYKLAIINMANLGKIDLKSRINATKNNVKLCHNDVNLFTEKTLQEGNPVVGNASPKRKAFGSVGKRKCRNNRLLDSEIGAFN
nr:MAG TPA: hypothetical protein [Microviridae sp.]